MGCGFSAISILIRFSRREPCRERRRVSLPAGLEGSAGSQILQASRPGRSRGLHGNPARGSGTAGRRASKVAQPRRAVSAAWLNGLSMAKPGSRNPAVGKRREPLAGLITVGGVVEAPCGAWPPAVGGSSQSGCRILPLPLTVEAAGCRTTLPSGVWALFSPKTAHHATYGRTRLRRRLGASTLAGGFAAADSPALPTL